MPYRKVSIARKIFHSEASDYYILENLTVVRILDLEEARVKI